MNNQKKRILIFSTAYFPLVGGAEVAMKEITDRLPEYEFVMITAKLRRSLLMQEKIGNITVRRVGLGVPFFDKFFLAVFGGMIGARLHRKQPFAGAWSLMASYSGFATLSFSQKTGVPYLLTLQEGDPIEYILHRVRHVRRRFHKIFSEAHSVQAISRYLLQWGRDMGFAKESATVVPNGVDTTRFAQKFSSEDLAHVRSSFGFPTNAFILVTASRLVVKNGVEDVIRALPLLPPSVCFLVCGVGELETHLKEIVGELQLESRVKFLGNCSHEELPKILQASDAFIRPSLTEGLGNSFLEAMAAGLPTIGTLVGGIPDFLEDGVTGFVCQPQDSSSVAKAVERILVFSPEAKEQVCTNAQKMVNEKYTWDTVVAQMRAVLVRLCV